MEVSNIRAVLQALTTNHITVPIHTNQFEETCAMSIYDSVLSDPFADLDDFAAECNKPMKEDNIQQCTSTFTKPSSANVSPIRSLLDCLYSVDKKDKHKTNNKIELIQMILNFKEYIANTLVKDLDVTKFKLTKKKLKEDLDFIYQNVDTNNNINGLQEYIKSLLVVASRNFEYVIEVKGDIELVIQHKGAKDKVLKIECHNGSFSLA